MSEHDARSAAFAPRRNAYQYVEWEGHRYEVRPPTLAFQQDQEGSKESATSKAVRQIIHCTYWPPDAPPDDNGDQRAGKPMFSPKDFSAILAREGDPGSLWVALLLKIGEIQGKARAANAVEEEKGNSDASPSSSPS